MDKDFVINFVCIIGATIIFSMLIYRLDVVLVGLSFAWLMYLINKKNTSEE